MNKSTSKPWRIQELPTGERGTGAVVFLGLGIVLMRFHTYLIVVNTIQIVNIVC